MKETVKLHARIIASLRPPFLASVARREEIEAPTESSMESILIVRMPSMASLVAPILLSACDEALMRSPLIEFASAICMAADDKQQGEAEM